MVDSFLSFIYFKFKNFSNIIEMNKWLLVTLFSVFVINLTFKSSNAATIGRRSIFNSHIDGMKRYVLRHTLIILFRLILFFMSHFFCSITIQRVKRNCTTSGVKYRCRNRINNSTNKMKRGKESFIAHSTTETLLDEEWGVRIEIFRIFSIKVIFNNRRFGWV